MSAYRIGLLEIENSTQWLSVNHRIRYNYPHKSSSQTCDGASECNEQGIDECTHITKVAVEHLDIAMNDLKCDEFVVPRGDAANKE